MLNNNSALDPQSPESRLAHVHSNETPPNGVCESHRGWPGDGSGEDDLADLMAHGDEGCCDDSEDCCDDPPEDDFLEADYEDRFYDGCE